MARLPLRLTARRKPRSTPAQEIVESEDASLLDVVDNALTKGVVLSGDLMLALAQVDLVYARLSLLLCAADRVQYPDGRPVGRRRRRPPARRR